MNHKKPDNRTNKRKIGDLGEDIACRFLVKRGFEIIERNYLRKWGEIDIVARKGELMRFVEVKSVSCATFEHLRTKKRAEVTHATQDRGYRPEENMHPWKLKRLSRAIQTYLIEKKLDCDWQLDLITVKLNMNTHQARVELIENVNI